VLLWDRADWQSEAFKQPNESRITPEKQNGSTKMEREEVRTSECQVQSRHWKQQSLAVMSAVEACGDCRQSVDRDSWQRPNVADTAYIDVLMSERYVGDW